MTESRQGAPSRGAGGILAATRALAVLTALELLWQFATAGQMVGPAHSSAAKEAHATGAIVLHVLAGLLVVATVLMLRAGRAAAWVPVLALAVFAFTFLQAYLGEGATLWLHVPGACLLLAGSIWLAAWSLSGATRR